MPSPKPDAAPVMIATLSFRRAMLSALTMIENNGLGGRHVVERLEALLPSVTGLLETAERQLDAAARTIAINEDLTGADAFGDAVLPAAVVRPDSSDEAKLRTVGETD